MKLMFRQCEDGNNEHDDENDDYDDICEEEHDEEGCNEDEEDGERHDNDGDNEEGKYEKDKKKGNEPEREYNDDTARKAIRSKQKAKRR